MKPSQEKSGGFFVPKIQKKERDVLAVKQEKFNDERLGCSISIFPYGLPPHLRLLCVLR